MTLSQLSQLSQTYLAQPDCDASAQSGMALLQSAARKRDELFPRAGSPTLAEHQLDASTPLLQSLLVDGAEGTAPRDGLSTLALLALRQHPLTNRAEAQTISRALLWHEAHSGLQPLSVALEVLSPAEQQPIAEGLAELLSGASGLARSERLMANAWLSHHPSEQVRELALSVPAGAPELELDPARGVQATLVQGELSPTPCHPVLTTVSALSGWLFASRTTSWLGRRLLGYRRPVAIRLDEAGLEVAERTLLLGRQLRERRTVLAWKDVSRLTREVRYPRLGLYAGLAALCLGSLVGTRFIADGLRVAGFSPTLVGLGLVCVLVGIGLDLLLSGLSDAVRGRCRLLIVARRGSGWAVSGLEPAQIEPFLAALRQSQAARG